MPSIAQQYLLHLVSKRQLSRFCAEFNVNSSYVYQVAKGERTPAFDLIDTLKSAIPPQDWFNTLPVDNEDLDYLFEEKIPGDLLIPDDSHPTGL